MKRKRERKRARVEEKDATCAHVPAGMRYTANRRMTSQDGARFSITLTVIFWHSPGPRVRRRPGAVILADTGCIVRRNEEEGCVSGCIVCVCERVPNANTW